MGHIAVGMAFGWASAGLPLRSAGALQDLVRSYNCIRIHDPHGTGLWATSSRLRRGLNGAREPTPFCMASTMVERD